MNDDQYINLINQTLSADAFWSVNKAVARQIGIEETAFLAEIIFKFNYWKARDELDGMGGFFLKSDDIQSVMGIGIKPVARLTKSIQRTGLVKVKKRGVPAKNYWYPQWSKIYAILTSAPQTGLTANTQTGGTGHAQKGVAITKNLNQESNMNNEAIPMYPNWKEPKEKSKKEVSTESIQLSKPIYDILNESVYKVERSKTLTEKIAKAVKELGGDMVARGTLARIEYMRKSGKDLYFHSFIADFEVIEWQASQYKEPVSGWHSPQPESFDHEVLAEMLRAV